MSEELPDAEIFRRNFDFLFFKKLVAENRIVVVTFTASWCEKCPAMKNMVGEVQHEMSADNPQVVFYWADVDTDPDIKAFAKIKAVPMVVVYRKGKLRDFLYGTPDKDALVRKITTLSEALDTV